MKLAEDWPTFERKQITVSSTWKTDEGVNCEQTLNDSTHIYLLGMIFASMESYWSKTDS